MRAIAKDESERATIAQNRSQVEQVPRRVRRFVRRQPKAYGQHQKRAGASDIERHAPAGRIGDELRHKEREANADREATRIESDAAGYVAPRKPVGECFE